MFMRSLCAIGAIAAIAGSAQAGRLPGQFEECASQDFGFPLSPGMTQLEFAKFDTMGDTRVLTAVKLKFTATVGAQATAENDSVLEAPDFAINLAGFVNVSVAGGLLSGVGTINVVEAFGVGATDGVVGSGPDFHDFGFVSDMAMDDDLLISAMDLASFIGPGSVFADIEGSAGFSFSGTTDATLQISELGASGIVEICYCYDVVPTPGAVALFGFAGVAAVRRRR